MKRNVLVLLFPVIILFTAVFAPNVFSAQSNPTLPKYEILKVDFHVHTNYSDGFYSPEEVVQIYASKGYNAIAITDHNTVNGYERAKIAANNLSLIVIRGEELTYEWNTTSPSYSGKHMLGLFLQQSIPYNASWDNNTEVEMLCNAIHDQDGLAFACHPTYGETWKYWQTFTNASFIDGWEFSTTAGYLDWLLRDSTYLYVRNHDFHGPLLNEDIDYAYGLLLCTNRTEAAIREALEKRMSIAYYEPLNYYGSTEALVAIIQNRRYNYFRLYD